jgi:hypothetical protein
MIQKVQYNSLRYVYLVLAFGVLFGQIWCSMFCYPGVGCGILDVIWPTEAVRLYFKSPHLKALQVSTVKAFCCQVHTEIYESSTTIANYMARRHYNKY